MLAESLASNVSTGNRKRRALAVCSTQEMLALRSRLSMAKRGVLCAACHRGYGYYVSVRTGDHVCRECHRSMLRART